MSPSDRGRQRERADDLRDEEELMAWGALYG